LSLYSGKDPKSILAKDVISSLDEKTGLRKWIIDTAVHPKVGAVRSQIFEALIDYSEMASLQEFLAHINHVKSLNATEIRGTTDSRVKLLTVFKAKGLEFPVVIVPNMNSAQMDIPATASKDSFINGSQEEERRIFYVAMTRAIHDLHIFYTSNEPSTYLTEASYKDVEKYVSECAAVFRGNLALLAEDDGCYFLEKLLAHMYRYQVGNACARSWARVLDQEAQQSVYGHLLARIEEHMQRESSRATEKKQEAWCKLRDFLDNINANACRFRDSASIESADESERERFDSGSCGDKDIFDVIINEDQEEFE
jgi:ATP-dependent exoDNAse (exonuclease V) beta subunit